MNNRTLFTNDTSCRVFCNSCKQKSFSQDKNARLWWLDLPACVAVPQVAYRAPAFHSVARAIPSTHNSLFLSLSLSLFSRSYPTRLLVLAICEICVALIKGVGASREESLSLSHTQPTLLFLSCRPGAAHSLALPAAVGRLPGDRRGNTSKLTNSINRKGEKRARGRASGACALCSRISLLLCVYHPGETRAVFVSTFYYVRCRVRGGNPPPPASLSATTHRIHVHQQ